MNAIDSPAGDSRRTEAAPVMAGPTAAETPTGLNFLFRPSLDRSRVPPLARLEFIDRNGVVRVLSARPAPASALRGSARRRDRR